jgi:hypothetical protein
MTDRNKGGGAFNTGPLDAGPEQGGSNMGGLGSTGAMYRERDPEAEGMTKPTVVTSARDQAILDHGAEDSEEVAPEGS